jgi:seryl-tRNA synthetase
MATHEWRRFDATVGADGRATLGPDATALSRALDANFAAWGSAAGADPITYPPLMSVADLATLDYFDNFPHLASVVAGLDPERYDAAGLAPGVLEDDAVAPHALSQAVLALPSAACYSSYLGLRGAAVGSDPVRITTAASCFRREKQYEGLRRLHGFTMREIICIGSREAVLKHLDSFKQRISRFLAQVGLPFAVEAAQDPFFDPNGGRSIMQKLFPVKEEFLFGGQLAIASVNFHRNFFGERCDIRLDDGSHAFSGCVAFGIERWLAALGEQFADQARHALQALAGAEDWLAGGETHDTTRPGGPR